MIRYSFVCLSCLCLAVFVTMSACSQSTTKKSDVSPAASTAAESKDTKQAGPAVPDQSAASSLEALQRGESTASSAEGPLKDVYFDYDRYDLRPDARDTLKGNAAWLKTNTAARVQIEGHADERGTNEYNLALGARRAQSVKDYLVTLGAGAERMSTISYGEEVPVCREQTDACWQKNRRARFVVQPARPAS